MQKLVYQVGPILNVTRYRMAKIKVKTILGHNNLVFPCFYDFINLLYWIIMNKAQGETKISWTSELYKKN